MRHQKSGRHLNRTSSHRTAMFKNMMASLFKKELIKTTLAKAKELRRFAEPLITLAKKDTQEARKLAFDRIRDKVAVGKLFAVLGKAFKERPGGYLRILKCGFRHCDNAPMAYVELIGQAERKVKLLTERADKVKVKGKKAKEAAPSREQEEF